jgi:hypothetical protein
MPVQMFRRNFLKLSGLAAGTLFTAEKDAVALPDTAGERHQRVTLSKDWTICRDDADVGLQQAWYRSVQSGAVPIRVPSILQEAFPAYHGVVWYWTTFQAPSRSSAGARALLMFHAVDYYGEVWVNGTRIGSHEGGETPFTLDATKAIQSGGPNLLAVRVLNPPTKGIDGYLLKETPHGNKADPYATGNRYDYGGIVEPVELLLTTAVRITEVYVRPDWQSGTVRVRVGVTSYLPETSKATLTLTIAGGPVTQPEVTLSSLLSLASGDSVHEQEMHVENHRLWDIEDPCVYALNASVTVDRGEASDAAGTHFGFRDFRLKDGFFHLNGRKIFVKCTHTGDHVPYSQVTAPPSAPDMLRMDLIYAKAAGFNMVRFISGVAHPYQLDLCDELGLMVYEESLASWLLADSPQMKSRFEDSVREMVLRDRNHPSITMWGLLNETEDGPVFREAVAALPMVRELDADRLLLLSSGRFDGHLEVGSACNPGQTKWEYVWGNEGPHAGQTKIRYPSGEGTGDFHFYPTVPESAETKRFLRTLGRGEKPVFISEYGIGSMMHVLYECRRYEQAGVRADAEDNVLMHSMAAKLLEDWKKFGMESAYPFAEELLEESERSMALHRQEGFDLIRSNPQIAGFNLTGMLDHGMTGEGLWRFWREWKPAVFDAVRDGWSPVRWCLFAEPSHVYDGGTVEFEAVLANEGVIPPGTYEVEFRAAGPNGAIAWEHKDSIEIADRTTFAVPVVAQKVVVNGGAGTYRFIPNFPRGIATPFRAQAVHVSSRKELPRLEGLSLTGWGLSAEVSGFLKERGATVRDFGVGEAPQRECIVVGLPGAGATAQQWSDLARRVAQGGFAFFLSPAAFSSGSDGARWYPASKKGRIYELHDWLYHKECVGKPSPFFEGLQAEGLLRWSYFGPTLPTIVFDGFEFDPAQVSAAAFATGYSAKGGYASGVLLAGVPLGAGLAVVNSFAIAENIGFPVADRMLVNAVRNGCKQAQGAKAALPADFNSLLSQMGYQS